MVTAETAMVLPVLVLIAAIGLAVLGHGIDQVRCVDAARAGARAAARGDADQSVVALARVGAPDGSRVSVSAIGSQVTVEVAAPGRASWLPGLAGPSARAVADREAAHAP
ncbi:MAG: TadE family type IV pilus minor pilin [Dermatophilaceae bacterium]